MKRNSFRNIGFSQVTPKTIPFYFCLLAVMGATSAAASGELFLEPGTEVARYPGYKTTLHEHPGEGFTPCMVLTNATDEIHTFIDKPGDAWVTSLIYIAKGNFSPIGDLKIGDPLSKVRRVLPQGKLV